MFIIKDCTSAQTGRVFETKEDTKHIHPAPDIKPINDYIPSILTPTPPQAPQTEDDTGPRASTLVWRALCALYTTVCVLAEVLVLA